MKLSRTINLIGKHGDSSTSIPKWAYPKGLKVEFYKKHNFRKDYNWYLIKYGDARKFENNECILMLQDYDVDL